MVDTLIKRLNSKDVVSRNDIQNLAVLFAEKYKRIWLKFSVGTGKGLCGGLIGNSKKVLYVSSRTVHLINIKEDLDGFNIDYSNWDFLVIDSIEKYRDTKYDVLILNEADDCVTTNNLECLLSIECEKTLLLTADATDDKELLLRNFYVKKWEISIIDIIKWKIFPNLKIHCISVNLDNTNKYLTHKRFNKEFAVTEKEKHDEISKDITYWIEKYKETNNNWHKITFLRLGIDRKNVFNIAKLRMVKELFKTKFDRTILFLGSIEDCKYFPNPIHSNQPTKVNLKVIQDFNSGIINSFANVDIVQRDINLNDVKTAIVGSFDSSFIGLYQKIGRLRNGELPEAFIYFVKDTKNEKDLQKFVKKYKLEPYCTWS